MTRIRVNRFNVTITPGCVFGSLSTSKTNPNPSVSVPVASLPLGCATQEALG